MKEISFKLNNRKLAGLAFGDSSRPLVLALHGWLDNAASFEPISAFLRDYYVVAIDLAGHGHSDHRPFHSHYHFSDFVQDLHELILHNDWMSFGLLGHSMGGMIGSVYAACFPERVNKLICIESFGPLTSNPRSAASQLRESIESRCMQSRKSIRQPKSIEHAVAARLNATQMLPENAQLLMERNLKQVEHSCVWRTDHRLRTVSAIKLTEAQAQSFLERLSMPTLIVRGTEGYPFILEQKKIRSRWIKNLRFEECEGNHHLHMDNPQQVADVINRFMIE